MKHRFFKEGKTEMVEITCDPTNVIVRVATKEDHDNAKHDDPDVQPEAPAKKPKHSDDE